MDKGLKKHKERADAWEQELREVFPVVENHAYIITLTFDSPEEFLDYILQVCKPVREVLEVRREEFLTYLRSKEELKNGQGVYEITRDTFLFTCRKAENKED